MPRIIIKIVKKQFAYKNTLQKKQTELVALKKNKNIAAECPFKIYVTYSFIFTKEEKNKTQINVIVR